MSRRNTRVDIIWNRECGNGGGANICFANFFLGLAGRCGNTLQLADSCGGICCENMISR